MTSKIIRVFLLCILALFSVPIIAMAFDLRSGEEVRVDEETIAEDTYIAGGQVSFSAAVEGDLVAAGGRIFYDGEVTEDVLLTGGNVTVLGEVSDDARIAGGNIEIGADVGDGLFVAGGTIVVREDATILGDVLIFGGTVNILGSVDGDVRVYGGDVTLSGEMNDVVIRAERVSVTGGAVISGDLDYRAQTEAEIAEGAEIAGDVSFEELEMQNAFQNRAAGVLFKLAMVLAAALLLGLVFRRFSERVAALGTSSAWWKYLFLGFAVLILTPVLSVLLFATVIGLPIGFALLFSYIVLLIAAWIYSAILIGMLVSQLIDSREKAENKTKLSWQVIVIGVLIHALLSLIPYVGWIVNFGFMLIALGALGKIVWGQVGRLR